MDFKLFKLNLKIAWMKAIGKLDRVNKSMDFTSTRIDSPKILIIFPIDKEQIPKSMEAISDIINSQEGRDAKFSFIINNNIDNKMNFYDIETLSLVVLKSGKIDNLNDILDKIFFKKFDIIIDLNIKFKIEIAMMVNELESKYKIGFASKYSDYFYNVQLKAKDTNAYEPIKDIIG